MFDVGFQELFLIGVVALLVVGPERLPRLARTAGLWLGQARRVLGSVKLEIDRELKADELREILRKQAASNPLNTILEELHDQPHPTVGAGGAGNDVISTAAVKIGSAGDPSADRPGQADAAAGQSALPPTQPSVAVPSGTDRRV